MQNKRPQEHGKEEELLLKILKKLWEISHNSPKVRKTKVVGGDRVSVFISFSKFGRFNDSLVATLILEGKYHISSNKH